MGAGCGKETSPSVLDNTKAPTNREGNLEIRPAQAATNDAAKNSPNEKKSTVVTPGNDKVVPASAAAESKPTAAETTATAAETTATSAETTASQIEKAKERRETRKKKQHRKREKKRLAEWQKRDQRIKEIAEMPEGPEKEAAEEELLKMVMMDAQIDNHEHSTMMSTCTATSIITDVTDLWGDPIADEYNPNIDPNCVTSDHIDPKSLGSTERHSIVASTILCDDDDDD